MGLPDLRSGGSPAGCDLSLRDVPRAGRGDCRGSGSGLTAGAHGPAGDARSADAERAPPRRHQGVARRDSGGGPGGGRLACFRPSARSDHPCPRIYRRRPASSATAVSSCRAGLQAAVVESSFTGRRHRPRLKPRLSFSRRSVEDGGHASRRIPSPAMGRARLVCGRGPRLLRGERAGGAVAQGDVSPHRRRGRGLVPPSLGAAPGSPPPGPALRRLPSHPRVDPAARVARRPGVRRQATELHRAWVQGARRRAPSKAGGAGADRGPRRLVHLWRRCQRRRDLGPTARGPASGRRAGEPRSSRLRARPDAPHAPGGGPVAAPGHRARGLRAR